MICEITVDDEVLLSSSSKWLCAESKTIFNEFREGETYDANKEQVWCSASVANSPGGILKKQTMPPVLIREVIDGKKINSHIYADMNIYTDTYDFGVNLTGNVEITVKGKKGDVVKIEYSERLRDDFSIDIENITNGVFTGRFSLSYKDNTLNVTIPQGSTASFKFNGIEKTLNAGEHTFEA